VKATAGTPVGTGVEWSDPEIGTIHARVAGYDPSTGLMEVHPIDTRLDSYFAEPDRFTLSLWVRDEEAGEYMEERRQMGSGW